MIRRASLCGAVALALLMASTSAHADPITITVALIEIGVSTAVAATIATVVSFVAAYGSVIATIGTIWYGNYQRRKAAAEARRKWLQSLEDRYTMATLTNGARQRVYGRCRSASDIIFKRSWGPDSEVYTLLISVAGHQVHGIPEVYLGDKLVTLDANGWVQNDPWKRTAQKRSASAGVVLNGSGAGSVTLPYAPLSGSVSVVQVGTAESSDLAFSVSGNTVSVTGGVPGGARVFYQYNPGSSFCRIRKYLGGSSQNLYSALVADFPELTSTDRFAGDAMLRVDMYYSTEAWAGGIQPITAVVEGLSLYDPRTGTSSYSENPALFARDWSLYEFGGGLEADHLVGESFIAAANACDITHTFTQVNAAGTETEVEDKLYRGGIVCRLEGNPEAYLAEMCEGMGGRYGWSGGRLMVVAGVWRSPVVDIDESWFSDQGGEVNIAPETSIDDAVNSMRLTIADEANGYVVTELSPLTPAAYLAADGRELVQTLEMQTPQTSYHALHIGGVFMREARQGLVLSAYFKPIALQLELFDVVRLTVAEFGWSAKTFEVQSWGFTPRGSIAVSLKETTAAIYDPDAGFEDLGWSDNTNLPQPSTVPQVEGLGAESGTADLVDGSVLTRTRVSWDPVGVAAVTQGGSIEVQYIEATTGADLDAAWASATEPGSATETIIPGLRTNRVYLFRARARTPLARGEWSVQLAYRIGGPPAASISGDLTKPVAVVAASAAGSVASFSGTGGTFVVKRNAVAVDPGLVTFSVVSETGADVSINSSGVYTVTSMSADTGTAVFRAVYDGVTIDRGYSISKAKAGNDGTDGSDGTPAPGSVGVLNNWFAAASSIDLTSPYSMSASVTLLANGQISSSPSAGSSRSWYSPTTTGIGADYEARAVLIAGDTPTSGTLGTWQAFPCTFGLAGSVNADCLLSVQVRDTSTGEVLGAGQISLDNANGL